MWTQGFDDFSEKAIGHGRFPVRDAQDQPSAAFFSLLIHAASDRKRIVFYLIKSNFWREWDSSGFLAIAHKLAPSGLSARLVQKVVSSGLTSKGNFK